MVSSLVILNGQYKRHITLTEKQIHWDEFSPCGKENKRVHAVMDDDDDGGQTLDDISRKLSYNHGKKIV